MHSTGRRVIPSAGIFVTLLLTMRCSASYLWRKLVLCVLPKGGGDMRNIIEELYYGNICPMDRQIVKGGDYSRLLHLLTRNEDYDQKVAAYSQQMDTLQERQRELKATAGRYAEVKYWLDAYTEHVQSGQKMDVSDTVMIRQLTDRIVVYDDRMEIHLRIGDILEQKFLR